MNVNLLITLKMYYVCLLGTVSDSRIITVTTFTKKFSKINNEHDELYKNTQFGIQIIHLKVTNPKQKLN